MSLAEELELVPPENCWEIEKEYNNNILSDCQEKVAKNVQVQYCQPPMLEMRPMVMAQRHIPIIEERRIAMVHDDFEIQKRLVYINFYTHSNKKVVQMHLEGGRCLEQITRAAAELFPTVQWRICSGTQQKADFEFLTSRQVWDSIKRSPVCRFYYLLVRLERAHPTKTHDAQCDNCRQFIIGHRYKCTECADFDICQSCEGRSVHREHAMLRLVDSGTHVPKYITHNAPRYVFDQFNGY
ncbi:hypothetical protein CAEBREN_04685 [Caenorhabditis brenneri]|uniref:ZZ-type domain-containing protein n=1 Tax=Caenorhabditis brenneri TaxID=135651 RepID=G0PIS2_CAEBE|nr:hypothetical protein CAEBREN_04685 [Caenorhabditis brenneri]